MSSRRPRPDAGDRKERAAQLDALRALYDEVDARFAGWTCEASTDCCHFGRTGREPYVTAIELAAVVQARARAGRKVGPVSRRALPIARDERRCPLLDDAGRCSVYEARPFGCRTFFCDRALPGEKIAQREINAYVARIRELARSFEDGDEEGRPLTRMISR